MTIPFLTVKPKSIKCKVSPRFPAQLIGGVGTNVTKANGNYTVDLNYAEFAPVASLPSPPLYTLIWNGSQYSLVPTNLLYAAGLPEAPIDGTAYGRQSAAWVQVLPLSGGSISGTLTVSGAITAATAAVGTNTTQVATTAFVANEAVRYDAAQGLTATQQHQAQANIGLPAVMRSYLTGLTLSTAGSSTTFSVAAGLAVNSTNVDSLTLGSPISKTTGAWAVGTGNGALDTGAIANSTWYHVYLIKRPDSGVVDIATSLSASAPTVGATIPAAYTLFRRIGSMRTNASAQWTAFTQLGDEFLWLTPINNASSLTTSTTASNLTLTTPLGVQCLAKFSVQLNYVSAAVSVVFYSPDMATQVAGTPIGYGNITVQSAAASASNADFAGVRTNITSQIAIVSSGTGGQLFVNTYGWIDRRGRDL